MPKTQKEENQVPSTDDMKPLWVRRGVLELQMGPNGQMFPML